MRSVEDDYLLVEYYYGVVWRASQRKRVQRDYDYLDYFVSALRPGLILTSGRPSGRDNSNPKAGLSDDLRLLFLCRLPRQFGVLLGGPVVRKTAFSGMKTTVFAFPVPSDSLLIFSIRLFLFRFRPSA